VLLFRALAKMYETSDLEVLASSVIIDKPRPLELPVMKYEDMYAKALLVIDVVANAANAANV
jgi:hypothetical protein